MAGHSGSKVAVIAAVIGNLAIAVIKFIAAAITGSSAMISEGIHSLRSYRARHQRHAERFTAVRGRECLG